MKLTVYAQWAWWVPHNIWSCSDWWPVPTACIVLSYAYCGEICAMRTYRICPHCIFQNRLWHCWHIFAPHDLDPIAILTSHCKFPLWITWCYSSLDNYTAPLQIWMGLFPYVSKFIIFFCHNFSLGAPQLGFAA